MQYNPSIRAEVVTRRTYSRPLNDQGTVFETWEQTIDRVIRHQKWLWERALTHQIIPDMPLHDITEDMLEWWNLNSEQEKELESLRELLLQRKVSVSGRQLWLGGTDVSKKREASQFNCAFSNVETVYDMVDIFWLLLQGTGIGVKPIEGTLTGFRKPIKNIQVIRSTRTSKGNPDNEEYFFNGVWTISIGDSAEAWAKSIGKLLAGKYDAHTLVLDFSQIRPAGERLKGYGWISSGDGPISVAYPAISEILNHRAGNILSKLDIIEIVNWLGTVLSSRRSAEITFYDYGTEGWKDFASFKDKCYEEGFKHRQQSNNSLMFWQKPTREQLSNIFDIIIESGGSEPGFINMEAAKKRAPYAHGLNPCAEILLGARSFCNLVELDVAKFKNNPAELHKAAEIIARANYRQTVVDFRDGILQESWHLNNEFLRLCGTGVTGVAQREDMTEYEWKDLRYTMVGACRRMAKELGLQHPKNVSTLKPSGTLSKIMDTTEGIHRPLGKFIFNWINFSIYDPIVKKLQEANYDWMINPTDSTGVIVCLPVKYENIKFTKKTVTRKDGTIEELEVNTEDAITQLNRYKKLQTHYVDHNVSNTIYYSPDEKDSIVDWLLLNWDSYVGVSFLFRQDPTMSAKDLGFNYLPQECVTEKRFVEYTSKLKPVDLNNTESFQELTDDECASGVCPVK